MKETRSKYLNPELLRNIPQLKLRVVELASGLLSGMHKSPLHGGAVEFSEYTEYTHSHELKHIDWKVFARSDKYYVKRFQDETNQIYHFLVDGSPSMDFHSDTSLFSKLDYSNTVAATLGYLLINQGDAISLIREKNGMIEYLPPSSKHGRVDELIQQLEASSSNQPLPLRELLASVSERSRKNSEILLFSDLLDLDNDLLDQLSILRSRGLKVTLFHVVDPAEVTLSFEGRSEFVDLETGESLLLNADNIRQSYVEAFQEHLDKLSAFTKERRINYHRFLTSQPLESTISSYLRQLR